MEDLVAEDWSKPSLQMAETAPETETEKCLEASHKGELQWSRRGWRWPAVRNKDI